MKDDDASFAELVGSADADLLSLESTWLFKAEGRVFGPVTSRELLDKLYAGEVDGETLIGPEDGEFMALRRYGAFRSHLPKVTAHRTAVLETEAENRAARTRHTRNVALLGSVAVAVLGLGGYGVVRYVEASRLRAAEEAKAQEEQSRRAAIERMMANLTIEPPLVDLGDEEKSPAGAKARGDRRRARIVAAAQLPPTVPITRAEIMDGVTESFGGLKRCILEQTERDPESVGDRIVMSFTVNNQGLIENFDLDDRQLRKAPIKDCFSGKLSALRFRRYVGEVQSVEYPITIGGRR